MTVDKAKLKALAQAANAVTADVNITMAVGADPVEVKAVQDYLQMAMPQAVLALLAEIEGLHAQHARDSGELRKLCSARDSARRQRDQLKAESEALRKDAERYLWLRQRHLPLDGHDFLSTQEILDRRIDAAMAKEAIHD